MIIEQLISAYLDGDLTPEQDQVLRSQISADPAARQAFDAAVLVHISLRCEDQTEVPTDLRKSVFDNLEKSIQRETRTENDHRYSGLFRGISAVAVLLTLICFPITDSYLQSVRWKGADRESTMENKARAQAGGEFALKSATTMQSGGEPALAVAAPEVVETATATESNSSIGLIREFALENASTNQTSTINGSDNENGNNENGGTLDQQHMLSEQKQLPLLSRYFTFNSISVTPTEEHSEASSASSTMPPSVATNVTLSTIYAAGLGSGSFGATNIQQMAASIAYEVGEDEFVGLEIGATVYTIEHSSTISTGDASGAENLSTSAITPTFFHPTTSNETRTPAAPGKLSSPEQRSSVITSKNISALTKQQTMWGSAFIQRRLIEVGQLSLNGRLGAGVAEDGFIGYGRVQGEILLGGSISIFIGSELRAMPIRTGASSANASSTDYGTFLTGLTGLHLRF